MKTLCMSCPRRCYFIRDQRFIRESQCAADLHCRRGWADESSLGDDLSGRVFFMLRAGRSDRVAGRVDGGRGSISRARAGNRDGAGDVGGSGGLVDRSRGFNGVDGSRGGSTDESGSNGETHFGCGVGIKYVGIKYGRWRSWKRVKSEISGVLV